MKDSELICKFWLHKFENRQCLFCENQHCTPYIRYIDGGILLCPMPMGEEIWMEEPRFSRCKQCEGNWNVSKDNVLKLAKDWVDYFESLKIKKEEVEDGELPMMFVSMRSEDD